MDYQGQQPTRRLRYHQNSQLGYRVNQIHQFLYLPSVASSYNFIGDLAVQSYKGNPYFLTNSDANRNQSNQIRSEIKEMVLTLGWQFCDTTEDIVSLTDTGIAAHGPRDWKHFNKAGYTVVKDGYLACFG